MGQTGTLVWVLMPDGTSCYCKCSCPAGATLVALPGSNWSKIMDIKVGDKVLALKQDKTWKPMDVKFSDGTQGDGFPVPYIIFVETVTGIQLIVTADHPFLLSTGKLQRASRLTTDDKLVDENNNPVGIKQVGYGSYTGPIWNISTSEGAPGEPMWGHLINTAGIVSGDYYAQLFLVDEAMLSSPLVGSPEYVEKHGTKSKMKIKIEKTASTAAHLYRFKPAKKFVPPENAVSLLPEGYTAKPGTLRAIDDTVPLEMARYIVAAFKYVYDDIVYEVVWEDNTVNSYAWMDGNTKHVAILGGICRHIAMKQEGIALVVAHETGHHYGGPPQYPDQPWSSCEGQADYWGACIGMRAVFWGPESLRMIQAGAEQLRDLFTNGLVPIVQVRSEDSKTKPKKELVDVLSEYSAKDDKGSSTMHFDVMPMEGGFCGHPPAECRYQTYLAALDFNPKPACAGS